MIDLERVSFIRISSQAPFPATPLWSSDGRRIVYCAFPSGEVFIRDAGSAEDEKVLFRAPSFTPLDDWSGDGRFLFYEVIEWRTSHTDVWVRDMKSGQSRPILQAKFNQAGARLSPDGAWLAYESDESGTSEIFVRSFPESRERRQVSTGGGNQARWRRDGRELFFISPDRKVMAVDVRTEPRFETEVPHALFQTQILPLIEARNHYDVTPDGQRFVVNSRRPEDAALPITVVVGWPPEKGK
jgi:eukaryotic-like serine/threonine-protein kinase